MVSVGSSGADPGKSFISSVMNDDDGTKRDDSVLSVDATIANINTYRLQSVNEQ